MEFTVETLGPCRKKISVSISPKRVGEAYDEKYGEINDNVAMPGFRPGKAPRKLLEKRFAGRLDDEIKDDLLKAALEQLLEDKTVDPLSPPEIDLGDLAIVAGEPVEFEFEMVTKPEFETPTYKDLEVKVPPLSVGTEEVDQAVDRLRRQGATLETAEDATVEEGDILVIDWRAMDGDSVEARDENAYYPMGRGVVAGFVAQDIDSQLEGKKIGSTAEASVQVAADDPREELRGRDLQLSVTLKEVKRYILPDIDEAFLKKNDYDDEEELRAELKKRISRAKGRQRDSTAENLLVEQLLDSVEISLPEDFVDRELESWAARQRMQLQMEHLEEEEIDKKIDAARSDAKTAIALDMQRHFLLDRIATAEDLDVTEAEMVQAIQEMAQAYGHPVEQVMQSFNDRSRLAELRAEILHRKARAVIRQCATQVEDASMLEDEPKPTKKSAKKKTTKKKAAKKKAAK